jgi:peptidoglycan hydrolase-like protein with peptidoglycan-binding domain
MRSIRVVPLVLLTALTMVVTAAPSEASADTKTAQRRLNDLGCDVGPVDGKLGTWTRAGIMRFQAANRLGQTGRIGKPTRTKLDADEPVRCDDRPVARHSHGGRRVVVSQRQNYVWLVRASGRVAAQGPMVDNPKVLHRGTYRAGSKCGRSAKIVNNSDVTGEFRLHNFVRFAPCGIGFHQIPKYWSNGRLLHSKHLLGTNDRRSHGCIRVSGAMSKRIWDFVHTGTRVVVVR